MQRLSRDETTILARKENEARCDLRRLARPPHRRGELILRIVVHRAGNQWRPDRPRTHAVHADALAHLLVGQAAGESYDGAFRARVVEEIGAADIRVDGGVIDDGVAGLHVRDAEFREVVEGVDVRVEGLVPLLDGEVGDVLLHHLKGGVVDQDVDGAHGGQGAVDNFLAVVGRGEVGWEEVAFAVVLLNAFLRGLGVVLFMREVRDHAFGAFHCEEDGNCAADA